MIPTFQPKIFTVKLAKKSFKTSLAITLLVLPNLANAISICYEEQDNFPYSYQSQAHNTRHQGLFIEIITKAAIKANLTINFIRRPWLRCQQMVRNNSAQALFSMIKTPDRMLAFSFPKNEENILISGQYKLFVKKGSVFSQPQTLALLSDEQQRLNIKAYKQQKHYGLSAPTGYVVNQLIKQHKLNSVFEYQITEGMQAVAQGKLDGYVVESIIGIDHIYSHHLENEILMTDIVVAKENLYIPFNKKYYMRNKESIDNFWSYLPLIRAEVINQYWQLSGLTK